MRASGTAQTHLSSLPVRSRTWDMSHRNAESIHSPVLLEEVVSFLRPEQGGFFVDATVGIGGHAKGILAAATNVELLGIDREAEALTHANTRLAEFRGRYQLVHANFAELSQILGQKGTPNCQGILADLGVSSLQFDSASRGFSFQREGPLDMRMDRDAEFTAAEIVNHYSEKDLADLIYGYGEERRSRSIARAILAARPIQSTKKLADVVCRAVRTHGYQKIHPATRTFQALRIFVNDELGPL